MKERNLKNRYLIINAQNKFAIFIIVKKVRYDMLGKN